MLIQTLPEFSDAVGTRNFFTDQPSMAFQTALELIRLHRELDVTRPEVAAAGLSLAKLIAPLLMVSNEIRFIKFDPWDTTILIKSFPGSRVVYQYNPFRDPANRSAAGQRPAPAPNQKSDFLAWETFPENEHYLAWTSPAGPRYGVLVQPAPIVPNHLIIASLDHNPVTGEHFDQYMQAGHLSDMQSLQVILGEMGYAMGFNGRHAGASVDHFHTQAVPRDYLPLVRAYAAGEFADAPAAEFSLAWPQVKVSAVYPKYATRGLLLEAYDLNALLAPKQAILSTLREQNLTFNSLSWHQPPNRWVEAVFPRGSETILDGAIKAGYVEMSGMLVIPQKNVFESIQTPGVGEKTLEKAGLSESDFSGFMAKLGACRT
ncbi:MAG: DUF4922 domain-containing protein [Candidatus Firestonebacteria bacterium]|nr:DUF4922 domain-containing protein [Candidatus Firestonebacteria bacterium]